MSIADEYQQIDDNTDIANSRFADSANKGARLRSCGIVFKRNTILYRKTIACLLFPSPLDYAT